MTLTSKSRFTPKSSAQKRPSKIHSAKPSANPLPQATPAPLTTKTADNKGRVLLGHRFANRPVIIEELSETEVVIKLARVIPESEAWLYQNPQALAAVRQGLSQARARKLTSGPDLAADSKLTAQLED